MKINLMNPAHLSNVIKIVSLFRVSLSQPAYKCIFIFKIFHLQEGPGSVSILFLRNIVLIKVYNAYKQT